MSADYKLCGWRLRSELPLPELLPWANGDANPPDILLRQGELPEDLPSPVNPGRAVMVGRDGTVLLSIPGLVRILVQDGRQITVQRLNAEDEGWRLFLLGSAFAFLCHQRGVYPLHAASLTVAGRTLALIGGTGAGKSTLALALLRRGHRLLSDDVSVLRMAQDGGPPLLMPAYPRLKLWRDSLMAQGRFSKNLTRVRPGLEKFDLGAKDGFDPSPRSLDHLLFLDVGEENRLNRLPSPMAAVMANANVFRPRIAEYMGRKAALFTQSGLVAATVPAWTLVRGRDFSRLEALADLVEGLVRS